MNRRLGVAAVTVAVAAIVASLLAALGPDLALADVGPPVHAQVTEREPGLYVVEWRVPKALPARAVPAPEFPEICRPAGETTVSEQPKAWLFRREWRCDATIAGKPLGMRYPFPDLAVNTVLRVNLLSGDRFAHVLTPGEGPWRLPTGSAAPDLVLGARNAVLAGISHVLRSWAHGAFVFVLALFGGWRLPIRLLSAFTLAQVGAVGVGSSLSIALGAAPAEIGFALGLALLARELLRPPEARRGLTALAAGSGVVHGLGIAALTADSLGDAASSLPARILAILGMDAAHLVGALALTTGVAWLGHSSASAWFRRAGAYGAGAAAMALAVGLALGGGAEQAGAAAASVPLPGGSGAGPSANPLTGTGGSGRVAPAAPDAPVQSFLAVEPFEVRHEAMVRLAGLAEELGLEPESTLEVDAQLGVPRRLTELILRSSTVRVDGEEPEALVRRADFMAVDPTGALPRPAPVPESVAEAAVGIVLAYPTRGMPEEVSLTWDPFPEGIAAIPATVIDPEAAASRTIDAEAPSLTWENALAEDPIPTVEAVAVEPVRLPLPLLSLPLLALSAALLIAGVRGRYPAASISVARVVLALAFLAGPLVQTAVALPRSAGRAPSERQAQRILAGLLPNVYRALEFRDEGLIYDRLAVSVTGETLTEVYLEQRRALQVEERGGAQARVETVEVLEATRIEPLEAGFRVSAVWTVGGMVTHFGHRHFRQNRYDARIGVVPLDGTWKVRSIEVLDQVRVR